MSDRWIWLPKSLYPDNQNTRFNALSGGPEDTFAVAAFRKEYRFDKKAASVRLRFSGDTLFRLWCGDDFIASGPPAVGGDFIGNDGVRENFYAFETTIYPGSDTLAFYAEVQMMPVQICDYSKGHGGFMLSGEVTFDDGTGTSISTDGTWLVRLDRAYVSPRHYDGRLPSGDYVPAEVTEDIWNASAAPIPVRSERELKPDGNVIDLAPGEEKETVMELDMIWAGFVKISAACEGEVAVSVRCRENEENGSSEEAVFISSGVYRGFYMHSAGNLHVKASNRSASPARIEVSFIETHYPVGMTAEQRVSDEDLNAVMDTCRHTLMTCRQTHHLDSGRHCEPMACTGDYYIESLMTLFSFGDMRLAEFDLIRTAYMLERENGRMFHTTYSCIWARMLHDTYMITGRIELLEDCEKALDLLLRRFGTYIGDNGLVESPPDFMFVDWIYIDGLSMHHPPKALGQSCLNMFYYGALDAAEKIYGELSRGEKSSDCRRRKEALREAINKHLFDAEKGIYFEGLNTPVDEKLVGGWMPRNVSKRYYLKHSNILAAYFGVCDDDTGRRIVDKIMDGTIEGDCQPYFLHYLLEAVFRLGLRERYTLEILEKWKEPVRECPKGLAEGFVKPEPTYSFDHSHAWGGTPLYSLPKALMGLEILEPGMKKIRLSPSLLGLKYAVTELPTEYGAVRCEQREGEAAVVSCPDGVEAVR